MDSYKNMVYFLKSSLKFNLLIVSSYLFIFFTRDQWSLDFHEGVL